jgi:hypothetical protein
VGDLIFLPNGNSSHAMPKKKVGRPTTRGTNSFSNYKVPSEYILSFVQIPSPERCGKKCLCPGCKNDATFRWIFYVKSHETDGMSVPEECIKTHVESCYKARCKATARGAARKELANILYRPREEVWDGERYSYQER